MKKKYLILIGILLVIFFSMLGIVLFDKNLTFDMSIYNFIISFRCDFLDTLFKAITACGNPLTIVALVVIFIVALRNKDALLLSDEYNDIGKNMTKVLEELISFFRNIFFLNKT